MLVMRAQGEQVLAEPSLDHILPGVNIGLP